MSELNTAEWIDLLPQDEQRKMLEEIAEIAHSCGQTGNYEPLAFALKQWENTAYYQQAFKGQGSTEGMSEDEAMSLAIEAQQAARGKSQPG